MEGQRHRSGLREELGLALGGKRSGEGSGRHRLEASEGGESWVGEGAG